MSTITPWSLSNIPSLSGKIAVVTGANTGLGFETAKALAKKGALVVMGCRDLKKAGFAAERIRALAPAAQLDVQQLDLGKLDSVHSFAERLHLAYPKIDLLINNAGIMMPPYGKTADGFEQQWGVNHLGHFLLTGLLLPQLEAAGDARVVHLASLAHKWGEIYFDDLNFEKKYNRQKSYGQSKLACLMIAFEMQRRLTATQSKVQSLAAHPGISDTELSRSLPRWMQALSPLFTKFIAQSARDGSLPSLRAALDLSLPGGSYIGPSGRGEYKGHPVVVQPHPKAKSEAVAKRLWEVSEQLAGIQFLN